MASASITPDKVGDVRYEDDLSCFSGFYCMILLHKNEHYHQVYSVIVRCTFYSEIAVGISANVLLLLFHILVFLLQYKLKPIELTICHLALAHTGMLLTIGLIATNVFVSRDIWGDVQCKSVLYLYRVMRALSICNTCQLSVLQAIILSPRSSCLTRFKPKSSQHVFYSFCLLWVLSMLPNARLFSTTSSLNETTAGNGIVNDDCSFPPLSYFRQKLFDSLVIFLDVSLISLMVLASGYMVDLLCKHRNLIQKLHSTSLSPRASPEIKATKTILLLMGLFVTVYFLDSVLSSSSLGILWNNKLDCLSFHLIVSNGYATLSPVMLFCTEKRMISFLKSSWEKYNKCFHHSVTGI